MLKIDKFLFCLELETAGLIIGWLCAVGFGAAYCLFAAIAIYGWFLGAVIQPNQDMWQQLVKMLKVNWFFFVYVFYCFLMSVAGIRLVRGTVKRNHNHLEMILRLLLIGSIASSIYVTSLISSTAIVIPVVVSIVVVYVYVFVCVFSLHQRFQHNLPYETL